MNEAGGGYLLSLKWRWGDSNPRPQACKACALPTELHPHETGAYIKFLSLFCQGLGGILALEKFGGTWQRFPDLNIDSLSLRG